MQHFAGLISLRKLFFDEFREIDNIEEIFDPKKITKLSIEKLENKDQLFLFTNLRSLILNAYAN